jgi:signal transduction histidine kinase
LFALRNSQGQILAGNLHTWPAGLGDDETWVTVETPDQAYHGEVATRTLGNGLTALAGNNDIAFREFRRSISNAVWIAISVVAVTCLFVAAAATNFILQRVRRLSEVARRVTSGDFSARAPDAQAGGPFDEIAHALNAMLDRIESLVVGLRTVTDSLAHDLRTPLAQTRRSLEQGVVGATFEEKHAALEQALAQTDRTLAAFTALADITRAEGGLSRDTMEDTDLRLLANDVRELFEPLAEERHIDLVARFQAVRLKAHKPLLMQAMSNLLHNAIKYAPSGSQVTLDLTPNGEGAEFVVGDHGPGIPAERRGDAVQRFKRVGQANQGEDGLGLGLAIVDACARLHGGALVLEDNAPGLRARFSLSGQ